MEGSLGPASAISEITAVSVQQFPWSGFRWCQEACGFNVIFSGRLPSIFRTMSLLSGQEVHNFQLTRGPDGNKAGPSTPLAFKSSQESPENDLELALGVGGKNPSKSPSKGLSSSAANGSLPRERLMHQAVEDLPQGVDPARKEVGTRRCSQHWPAT